MDDQKRLQDIFQTNRHLVLSTADKDGKPWVSPVSYVIDEANCLYWVSSKDARHSSNIRVRQEVAIVVYMVEPKTDAVYIDAMANELSDEPDIKAAIETLNIHPPPDKYRVKSVADVTGAAVWRIYKAVPQTMYFRDEVNIGGQAVTIRRPLA